MRSATAITAALALAFAACSTNDGPVTWDGIAGDGWADGTGDGWDVPGTTITVTGTVWSPGHVVPISGALVYFALVEPTPIPSGAYPETCEDPASPFWIRSEPDGTFQMQVSPGTWHLVVQKGQFRRVREVTIPETGPYALDEVVTTLPSSNDVGDTIPSMALLYARPTGDHIKDVLAKLDMGIVGTDNSLVMGSEVFDLYNVDGYEPNTALLGDLSRMLQYHIIFFPCTIDGSPLLSHPTAPLEDDAVLANIRAFLEAGGKIYATDMMYDVFEQVVPMYLDICGDDAVIDAGDEEAWAHWETMSGWTSHGQSVEPDLSAWLDAIGVGHSGIDFMENFVWIEDMYVAPPDILPGDPVSPTVWVSGDFVLDTGRTLPLTVTFPVGAGKVLFSTYHTVGDDSGLPGHPGILPQEYVLVYLIMEIGVCQSPII